MRRRILAFSCVAAAVIACNSPGSPTPPPPTPTPQVTAPQVSRLAITGPARFAPTSSPKFTATATLTDGTTQDYTTKVTWSTSDGSGSASSILTINSDGTATATSTGEAIVIAKAGLPIAFLTVMVIPDGTYRLVGKVSEAGVPVSGVTVSVISGTGAGLSATTDSDGHYRLYGVSGPVEVQASKAGYNPSTITIGVKADDVLDFPNIAETGGPPAIAGTYSLSIVAASDCSSLHGTAPLLASNRMRTYTAVVTENNPSVPSVLVTLSGANLVQQSGASNSFQGRLSPGRVTFVLDSGLYDDYFRGYIIFNAVVGEQLSSTTFLTFWGTVDASLSSSGISGTLSGNIATYSVVSPSNSYWPILTSCASDHHQFSMTPVATTKRRRQP